MHHVLQLLDDAARALGVSQVEMNVLANLSTADGWTVSLLGRATGLKPSTATGVLDRLEEQGLVERLPNPADRRSSTVALTRAGDKVARRVLVAIEAIDDEIRARARAGSFAGYEAVVAAIAAAAAEADN